MSVECGFDPSLDREVAEKLTALCEQILFTVGRTHRGSVYDPEVGGGYLDRMITHAMDVKRDISDWLTFRSQYYSNPKG